MTRLSSLLAILAALALPASSMAQNIVLSDDPQGASCYLPVVDGPGVGRFYILFHTSLNTPGITGAEFRITGMPAEYLLTVTPNPVSNVRLGNPFGDGCNIAFPACQTGANGVVLLYTVDFFVPTSGVAPFLLQVVKHTPPSGPSFECPLVVLCDDPVFTKLCVPGGPTGTGPILAVPSDPSPADGASPVELDARLSWSATGFQYCCGLGTPFTNVYFGTSTPPPFVQQFDAVIHEYDPGPLAPETTYYWYIGWTPDHDCGAAAGPIWSFTTGNVVGVESTTWPALKAMYR